MKRGSNKMGFYPVFLLLTDVEKQDTDKIFSLASTTLFYSQSSPLRISQVTYFLTNI